MEQPSIISQIQIEELKSCFIIVFQKYPFAVLRPYFFCVGVPNPRIETFIGCMSGSIHTLIYLSPHSCCW